MKRTQVQRSESAQSICKSGRISRIAKKIVRSLMIGSLLLGVAWYETGERAFAQKLDSSIYGTIVNTSIMNTSITNSTLNNYLRGGEFGGTYGPGCITACDPCYTTACDPSCVTEYDPCCTSVFGSGTNCRNLWGLAYGTGGRTQDDGNAPGYKQGFFGTVVGLDRLYGNTTRAGMYVSYGEGRISKYLDQTSDSKELLVGLYLRKELQIGYALLHGGLGYNQYDTTRPIWGLNARSKHSGFVGTIYGERGLEFQGPLAKWQPFLGLQYIGNQLESFTESGASGLNFSGDIRTGASFRSMFGTRLTTDLARTHRGTLALFGQGYWMHEFLNQTRTDFTGKLSAPGAQPFTVHGNNAGRDWFVFGTGLNYDLRHWRMFVGYDIAMNDRQVLHTGNAGLAYGW
ncbi:MAG: autotransporter outer membrane beta-barrel domain-containing protein [Planctomycetaceae bacterium]|nr:autotransporter outer membrane beta-barrel domain-containing protein [Planctomycetaceae bacterium]